MKLDHARQEKGYVLETVKAVLHEHITRTASGMLPLAQRTSKLTIPLLGVGIALGRRANDHRVAIRVLRHGFQFELMKKIHARHDPKKLHSHYIGRVFPAGTAVQKSITFGASVSHYLTGTGTAGCQVFDRTTGAPLLLSNNHVLGLENDAVSGDAIIEPGRDDGGSSSTDTVAHFARCVRIDFSGGTNTVDAAVASLAPGVTLVQPNAKNFLYDPAQPVVDITKSIAVRKLGRSTGITKGTVTAVEMENFWIDFENGPALFAGQIEVTGDQGPFAAHGDSGSLVVDANGAAVGLLFAVSEVGNAYVNPMTAVLRGLDVSLG